MGRLNSWYENKALACITAWQHRYGTNPTKHAIVMVCAVALHETSCGDDWNHSGNWGAIQRRTMTIAEKQAAASGLPVPPKDPFEEIHGDRSPINGKYKTWFWRFPEGIVYPPAGLDGDKAGAWVLLGVLLDNRPSIKAQIDTISSYELAMRMYRSHYYEGFHDPRQGPVGQDGLTDGQRLNIQDYAMAIQKGMPAFENAIGDWGLL